MKTMQYSLPVQYCISVLYMVDVDEPECSHYSTVEETVKKYLLEVYTGMRHGADNTYIIIHRYKIT